MAQMEYLNLGVQYFRLIKLTIFILALLICSVFSQATYTKYTETNSEAKCLDGSSPIVYLHQGSQTKNIMFYVLGSPPCFNNTREELLLECFQRSQLKNGSSSKWENTNVFSEYGILDYTNPTNKFANWTKIVIIECDGGGSQGNNADPVPAYGSNLFFRGSVNMRAHFKWAHQKYKLNQAKKIVLVGHTAVFLWIDYLKSLVPNSINVYGIADKAIVMNPYSRADYVQQAKSVNTFTKLSGVGAVKSSIFAQNSTKPSETEESQIVRFYKIVNAKQRPPNDKCTGTIANKNQDWKCLYISYARKFLSSKILWINSQYEASHLQEVQKTLGFSCLKAGSIGYTMGGCNISQNLVFNLYRNYIYYQIFYELYVAGQSVWSIACSFDSSVSDSKIYYSQRIKATYRETRLTIHQAVEQYVFDDKRIILVDSAPWPANQQCAY